MTALGETLLRVLSEDEPMSTTQVAEAARFTSNRVIGRKLSVLARSGLVEKTQIGRDERPAMWVKIRKETP